MHPRHSSISTERHIVARLLTYFLLSLVRQTGHGNGTRVHNNRNLLILNIAHVSVKSHVCFVEHHRESFTRAQNNRDFVKSLTNHHRPELSYLTKFASDTQIFKIAQRMKSEIIAHAYGSISMKIQPCYGKKNFCSEARARKLNAADPHTTSSVHSAVSTLRMHSNPE